MATIWRAPLILRGEVIDTGEVEYGGRRGEVTFRAPAVDAHLDRLTLRNPAAMADLHQLNFDDIVDYLERLGNRLDPARNVHLQEAFELARITSGLSDSVLRHQYESISHMLAPHVIRAIADRTIGIDYLEGWVEQPRGVLRSEEHTSELQSLMRNSYAVF